MIDTSENDLMRPFEWESIEFPLELSFVHGELGLYNLPENSIIKIWRDNQYKLKGEISGVTFNISDFQYRDPCGEIDAGQFVKGEIFEAYNINHTKKYKLYNCYLGQFTSIPSGIAESFRINFTVELILNEIFEETLSFSNTIESTRIEWFFSGVNDFVYPRSTTKFISSSYKKIRHSIDQEIELTPENFIEFRGGSRDFFFIETGEFSFIVQKVQKAFIPMWANAIEIEYKVAFKKNPDYETRKSISEIVGFVLGSQLLHIGYTVFDKDQNIINRGANTPWGINIIAKCESGQFTPINLKNLNEQGKIEEVLNYFVPAYLKLRKELDLKNVIWKYWISNSLAIGTNLPILSSSLESLAEAYLLSNKIIKKPTKEIKKRYRTLLDRYQNLCTELKEYEFGERIINKAKNPFNIGVGEKLDIFFRSLKINIKKDSAEDKALRSRNLMTHSSIGDTKDEIEKAVKLTRAYVTLFHRVFLKVFGYNGKYVDYYTIGHPEIDIDKNIGEE